MFDCCRHCPASKRTPGCHDHCPEYKETKAAYEARKAEYERARGRATDTVYAQRYDAIRKATRRQGRKSRGNG